MYTETSAPATTRFDLGAGSLSRVPTAPTMRYTQAAMSPLGPHQPILRLGAGLLLCGLLAGVWELLAWQSPGTPLYLGMLPGPIASLRELCMTLGFLMLITSLLLGWSGEVASRGLMWLLYVGALTAVGAQLYGAAHGMPGVQVVDFRPGVRPLFVTKHVALALVIAALIELGRRVLSGPRAREIRLRRRSGSGPVQLDSKEPRH